MTDFSSDRKNKVASIVSASSRGNTLAEYVFIGGTMVLVAIAGLMLLSSSINKAMAMLRDDMKTHQQAVIASLEAQRGGLSAVAGQLNYDELDILGQDLKTKLQTTGANGSTNVLANQIEKAAALMLANGTIDEAQYDILMKLANQGHKMAEIQGLISDAMSYTNGDVAAFNSMKFTLDGQNYTANELAKMIGFDGPSPVDFASADILGSPLGGTTGSAVSGFLDLYNQAVASGALSDPALKATVDSASTQIASLGELTEDITWNVQNNGMPMDDANITTLTNTSSTQMNSSKICTAGQFQDNGVLCTP